MPGLLDGVGLAARADAMQESPGGHRTYRHAGSTWAVRMWWCAWVSPVLVGVVLAVEIYVLSGWASTGWSPAVLAPLIPSGEPLADGWVIWTEIKVTPRSRIFLSSP